jgi:hypothetical protein
MTDDSPFLDHLERANLEGYLAWVTKHRRGYVAADPWPPEARLAFDFNWAHKHSQAVAWMTRTGVRRAAHTWSLGLHREGRPRARATDNAPRGIWTARKALRRRRDP